jgi:hypothetical protein
VAESTLSIGFSDLKAEVGGFLGYGRASASWSVAQLAEIDRLVQSGYRRVLYPPAVVQGAEGYEWSWLKPTTTLALAVGDGDYDLPDDFGRPVGGFHYAADKHYPEIVIVSLGQLLELRSSSDMSGTPVYAAIRYKAGTGTTGQRQEVLFYPEPDAILALTYQYDAYTGKLTDALPYPLGGMPMAEVYIESCLAVAEGRMNDELGQHLKQFQALLTDAIARDRKKGAHNYGHMGNPESIDFEFRRGYTGIVYPITYKGDDI